MREAYDVTHDNKKCEMTTWNMEKTTSDSVDTNNPSFVRGDNGVTYIVLVHYWAGVTDGCTSHSRGLKCIIHASITGLLHLPLTLSI